METFVRIVDAGSLSAAAAQLNTTQPTVSRRLQTLEHTLGVRLLHRSTHAMTLTEAGARCYQRAQELLESWQTIARDMHGVAEEPAGLLRVVVPHAFGQQQLIGPLAAFLNRFPRVRVEWVLDDHMPAFVAEGVDCAIRVGTVADPAVVALKLGEIPRIVVAAPAVMKPGAGAHQLADLANQPWLALQTFYRDEITLVHTTTGETQRLPIVPRLMTDSLFALRSALRQGLGIAVASSWAVAPDIAAGRLVHLLADWQATPLPIYLVYPQAQHYPAKLQKFIETIKMTFNASIAQADYTG
ncbi:MAG: LysR family transcriptional regulator [Devosia sp.]